MAGAQGAKETDSKAEHHITHSNQFDCIEFGAILFTIFHFDFLLRIKYDVNAGIS